MSQSAIMVFFKYDANLPGKQDMSIFSAAEGEKNRLSQINRDLELENMELRRKLDITATELKRFNVSLVEEMNYRTEREEMIRQMSYHDELTNLYNRRYFVDHLSTLDVEENLPLSVIYCDVDNLKITNDTFGHDKGDKLLKKAATSIKDSCRECGIVIRIGGDEFLVLLPKTPRDVALEIVERIHNNASKESINNNPIRVSFGLDTKDSLTQDINDVIKSAEKLMYKHKFERKTTIDQGDPHQ